MSYRTSSLFSKAAAVALGFAALAVASAAHAGGGVAWSVGISSPGVAVGVGAPMMAPVYAQPVYVQPAPVWQPTTIYSVPPVQYTQPAVVYPAGALVQPVVVQQAVPIHRGHHHHHYWR